MPSPLWCLSTSSLLSKKYYRQRIGSIRLTSASLKTVSEEPLTYPLYSNEAVTKGDFIERIFR